MGAMSATPTTELTDRSRIADAVERALRAQPIVDLHTHCYAPSFGASPDPGGLLLWGIDELVTYHYLIAETFRVVPARHMPYERFWRMTTAERADHIWYHLFVERAPVSEAARGVITTLKNLGLDPNERTLEPYRRFFAECSADAYIDRVMELANVERIVMTNEVFSDRERPKWLENPRIADDERFEAVLRIDPLLRRWPEAAQRLAEWGYDVREDFGGRTDDEARRFLSDWIARMKPAYVATSLPPSFTYPAEDEGGAARDHVIERILMPALEEHGLPWALMIGADVGANPELKDAGDMVGKADVQALVHLCRGFPNNRFLCTMLSRENQHELCVAARKFGNLMVFGCWWFMNNPSIISEITRERFELLGTTFIPQHSDARILDQLVYKWDHSLSLISPILAEKYGDLAEAGFQVTESHIRDDAERLLKSNYERFIRGDPL